MTVQQVIDLIQNHGWRLDSDRSHDTYRSFTHPIRPGRVTIVGNPREMLAPQTVSSILHQAGLITT